MSLTRLAVSLKQRGLLATLLMATCVVVARSGFARLLRRAIAYAFDVRHGTRTRGSITLDRLHIDSERKGLGTFYIATPAYEFRRVIANLAEDPAKYTFIDFGCGMGSALLFALRHNFRAVIGIEFSSYLARIAAANIAKFPGLGLRSAQIITGDAAEFSIPIQPCVLWFFNPFARTVTQEIVANIHRAHLNGHCQIYVIWYNLTPNAQPLFDAPWLEVIAGQRRLSHDTCPPLLEVAELCLPFSIFRTRREAGVDRYCGPSSQAGDISGHAVRP